jgi:hypothetical protein
MIEILQMLLSIILFALTIMVPFNIFNTKLFIGKNFFCLDVASFNLIINCNILLLISILPYSLKAYNLFFIFIYSIIFIYTYFVQNFKFNLFKNFTQSILIFSITFLILSISVAAELNLGWDAKYFYYIKALFFIENQNLGDLNKFSANAWHPHLGSFFWAFFWNLMPIKIEYFGRLFYVFLFIFSIFYICHNNLRDKFINNVIFILIILVSYAYHRFSGLQGILIFSFLVIISKYFFLLKNSHNTRYVFFIVLACNLMIWFKSEGIAYTTIIILLLNFSTYISKKIKIYSNLSYIGIIILKIIIYKYFDFTLNAQPYYLDYIFNLKFPIILHKLSFIIPFLFYYSLINIFFVAGFIILVALNLQKKFHDYIKILNYYFILNLIFIFCAYLLREHEIEHFVRTTMERTIFTSSGFYVFLIINFLKNLNKTFLK